MIYIYFLTIIVLIILLILAFFKLKQPFWSRQPVFHLYNLSYWFLPCGIIQHENNSKTSRFFDYTIQHNYAHKYSDLQQQQIVSFIKNNFVNINIDDIIYSPTVENIFSYFNNDSIISLKYKENNEIIGCISGRPLFCYLNNDISFFLNYVDYLCVHVNERKIGIAPKLIYSYYVHQREAQNNKICLFKKESNLTSIIPICSYYSYGLYLHELKPSKYINVHKLKFTQIIYNNIELLKKKFECVILPPNIDLIKINDINIYGLFNNNKIFCLFFFRNTYTTINNTVIIECFASINNTDINTFYQSFIGCLLQYYKDKFLIIEDISDNYILIKYLNKYLNIEFKSKTAYYFYNFSLRPIISNKVFILN